MGGFSGRVRILVTGGILTADATLIDWDEDGLKRWGGFLRTDVHSYAVLISQEENPRIELGNDTFPFTAVLRGEERNLRLTGHGPSPLEGLT